MSGILNTDKILEDNKNASQIVCVRCTSKILPPQMGKYEEISYELESISKDKEGQKEVVKQFLRIEDMFDFDNIGFTNTVDSTKFLSCADCDVGPLGFHDLKTKKSFLALTRVAFVN